MPDSGVRDVGQDSAEALQGVAQGDRGQRGRLMLPIHMAKFGRKIGSTFDDRVGRWRSDRDGRFCTPPTPYRTISIAELQEKIIRAALIDEVINVSLGVEVEHRG